jgi:hypothetical protein
MRSYIRDGALPKLGSVCGIESDLFSDGNAVARSAAGSDNGISLVAHDLSKKFKVSRFGQF